jgi:hypothetical protein
VLRSGDLNVYPASMPRDDTAIWSEEELDALRRDLGDAY